MSGHVEMQDSPPIVGDDEEAIENAEGECWHGEEVHCGDGLAVIAQERRPSLCRFGVTRRFPHPTQDGSLGDVEAEHCEFTVNARRSPSWVPGDHAENESTQLLGRWSSADANAFPRDPTPIQREAGAMPTDDSFRLDNEERLPPPMPESAQDDPEQPIWDGKPRMRMPTCQDGKLLPQGQVFEEEITAGSE